jgi:5-methylcytosine-specific restriction protein A
MIRLRVAFGRQFAYEGETRSAGEEFDGPIALLSTGLVTPADGNWRGITPGAPTEPLEPPTELSSGHEPCEPPAVRGALSVCTVAGCPCQVTNGKCAECRRASDRQRKSNHRAHYRSYNRKDWQSTRLAYLRAHPLCECEDCAIIPVPLRPAAQVVDHIDGLGPLGPRGHDPSNLRAMAKRCHDRRTMREQVNGE